MNRPEVFLVRLLALAGLLSLPACRLYRLETKLDPANADFLSRVSWIITGEERKVFLELPDAEKPAFIEEFWRRRDPDPATDENEFKDAYLARVEEAARLFRRENKPGWLTDRGRILILFGPPDEHRNVPSTSDNAYCYEQWMYGNFPVVFVDRNCSGDFRLETHDLSSLRSFNLEYMHELNRAQNVFQNDIKPSGGLFDFGARLEGIRRDPQRLEGVVQLRIPIDRLTFTEDGPLHRCRLEVRLEARDRQDQAFWESTVRPELELTSADLKPGKGNQTHSLSIPFAVAGTETVKRLTPDQSFLQITLTIFADGLTLKKKLEWK